MFSPQKSSWSGWSLTPRRNNQNGPGSSNPRNAEVSGEKEKGLDFLASPSSPRNPSADKYANLDKETLCDKISKLQNELFEYQYNMGLLLIEKKEWTSKYEALRQALAETDDAYKREQAAHLCALSEVEKREESLRKALGVEKQCVIDLEKALREMRSEYAEIKFTADSKLSEAKSLVTNIEEKSLEVEAKLRAVDARFAEISRKTSEIERKSQDVVAQENALRRARSALISEREAHEATIYKQKEDLREWEQKLREGEERLAEARSLLNQREQRANESDKILKQKEKELKDAQKKIDADKSTLNKEEEDIRCRLSNLVSMEKEYEPKRKSLEVKETQLQELEEKLNSREKVEMQKLLDEHMATLDAKEKEFELEIEQKRKSMEEELRNKLVEVQKKEAELNHIEEKIRKREQAIEKKLDKVKERENDLELNLKALKEREKSLRAEEKHLENERKQLYDDKENLLALQIELEKVKSGIETEQLKIREEREQLKVTEDERLEHARLQQELKQEIDKFRLQTEQLLKESENLKQERLRFEKEWEELDEKCTGIKTEFTLLSEQKEAFEKYKLSAEEKLNNEKLHIQSYVQRELDELKRAKDSFEASMEHEKSLLAEKTQNEKSKLLHDLELRKRDLEVEMLSKQEEMDSSLCQREKSFEEKRENELKDINYLRERAHREIEEMKVERLAMDKERHEILTNKNYLETQQVEMRKDVEELVSLSQKLKDQREIFIKERERFFGFIKQQKCCNSCAELVHEFELSDLHMDEPKGPSLPRTAEMYLKEAVPGISQRAKSELSPNAVKSFYPTSGESGTMSWLRKCTTSLLKFSPGKKTQPDIGQDLTYTPSMSGNIANVGAMETSQMTGNEQELSLGVADDSLDVQEIQSDNSIKDVEDGQDQSNDDERSQHSNAKVRQRRPAKRGKPRGYKKSKVKAAVTDTQTLLGKAVIQDVSKHVNGNTENNESANEESRGESGIQKFTRKRNWVQASQETSEHDGGEHSGHSDSFAAQRKRRQRTAQPVQASGENRYNLRRPRVTPATMVNGPSGTSNGKEKDVDTDKNLKDHNPSSAPPSNDAADVHGESVIEIHDLVIGGARSSGGVKESTKPVRHISADSSVRFNYAIGVQEGDNHAINHFAGETDISDEVNETPKRAAGASKGNRNEIQDEDDEDEEEVEHPGEASIGKKLWTFLTT